ncbi:phage tail protein [Salipiger aestuarii]|uniref:Head-tail adaptor n=1 Tax=Salipiger aestuarii TaxID=568098 RepID=A0A327YP77_9RHOB|nr:head-tail adaptor protein [Salipiger aestuarii]KAB2543677.1 phage tail protein [Salipiger aestuarii]RAK22914.1 head-tail adaptor [Salipiger aestuarii]
MSVPVLNRELALQERQGGPDGAGGRSETWVTLGTLWAEVTPRSGRQTQGFAGAVSLGTFRITVRGAPQGAGNRPVAGQRFVMGARIFEILAVTEIEPGGMYLDCDAREEVAA